MRPFDELTGVGRTRRLRRFANEVLSTRYDLGQLQVRLLSKHAFNTIFRVDSTEGRFVLRVGDATRIHCAGVEDVEAQWLGRLDKSGITTVPRPIASTDGLWRVDYETEYVSGQRACSMFTFVEGRELRSGIVDAAAMRNAGALLAQLHEHAASSLADITPTSCLRADRVIYFHEEDLIEGYQSKHGSLFREARDRVQQAIDELWRTPVHAPHLLHGDFGPHNLLTWRQKLRPIDFQDLQFGFPVQDLGITLADLSRNNSKFGNAFLDGYARIRPLPDYSPSLLAALDAGRSLNIMNLGLHLRRQGIEWFLQGHEERIAAWMATV